MMQTSAAAAIAALDLSSVCSRLMHPHAGYGWSEARTHAAEFAYRDFLLFAKTFPAETPTPTADVDAFWHFHILDTLKYARDCAMTFGYFLHHKPDLSMADRAVQPSSRDQILAIMREALAAGGVAQVDAYCAASNEKQFLETPSTAAYCALARPKAGYCAVAAETAADSHAFLAAASATQAAGRPAY